MLERALIAAQGGDRVCFVDSASRDRSPAIARDLGVQVVPAPAGKGRAMARALECCETRYICFLDADHFGWSVNVPATLRAATVASGAEMVIGSYREDRRRVISPFLYRPLADALFPDYGRRCEPTALSGVRVLERAAAPAGPLPGGYGIETHLNLALAAAGCRIEVVDVGVVQGPLRGYANVPEVAAAVAGTMLDFAVACGRLDPAGRERFESWVAQILAVLDETPPPGAEDGQFLERLRELSQRPPPAPALAAGPRSSSS